MLFWFASVPPACRSRLWGALPLVQVYTVHDLLDGAEN